MNRFSFGTKDQFTSLELSLNDGMCHIFHDCKLPDFCTPSSSRIGFEKTIDNQYRVLIDYGVVADCDDASFKAFLFDGERVFSSMDEIEMFFRSFSRFFDAESSSEVCKPEEPLFDENHLRDICKEKDKHKIVRSSNIFDGLKKRVFGQESALKLMSSKIAAHINSNIQKPLALVLVGPSGVGKTHTGKSVAGVVSSETGVQYGFISDSLNTIKSEHSVQKYLGAPPSYAGYGDKTVFDAVVDNPYHIILMDELDKAHPSLLEVLMEALDTGVFNLTNGQKIDMSRCIFIFTSNMSIDYNKYNALESPFERTTFCRDTLAESGIHNAIPRRIDEFIIYTKLDDIARANIIARYIKEAVKPYETEIVKIDENLMGSILMLNNNYGGDTLGKYITSLVTDKIESDDLYDEIRNKKIALKGTVKNIEIEIR